MKTKALLNRFIKKAAVWATTAAMLVTGMMSGMGGLTASAVTVGNWAEQGNYSTAWYDNAVAFDPNTVSFNISTAADLAGLAYLVNNGNSFSGKTVTLTENITDLYEHYWTPIGIDNADVFSGSFDGSGLEISGLTIGSPSGYDSNFSYAGLFGATLPGSTIKDLGVVNASISSSYYLGSIIPQGVMAGCLAGSSGSTITNCYATGNVTGTGYYSIIGGLVGNSSGTIINCYDTCSVTGSNINTLGGLAGCNSGSVINCFTTGNITGGSNSMAGGLTGINEGTVTNGYWNSDASQTVGGTSQSLDAGFGSGSIVTSTSLPLVVMMGSTGTTITYTNNTSGGTDEATTFIDALNGGRGSSSITDLFYWKADNAATPENGGYPVFTGTPVSDTTKPTLSSVTPTTVTAGDTISATSNEAGTVYLVQSGDYSTKAELDDAVNAGSGVKYELDAAGTAPLLTTGLATGDYQVYAVDTTGNVSFPTAVTVSAVSDTTAPTITAATPTTVTAGGNINVTANEESIICIVPTHTPNYTKETMDALQAAAGEHFVHADANTPTPISTSGLEAGSYQIYAADKANNISTPTVVTITAAAGDYDSGAGTPADPYILSTQSQLAAIPTTGLDKCYKLGGTINLTGNWTPIGNASTPFAGTFDGNGYKITGLTINDSTTMDVGLFGFADTSSVIKNIGVDVSINSSADSARVGGLIGENRADVINCQVTGTVQGGDPIGAIGGLVALNSGSVCNCYSAATVICGNSAYAGGLVGYNLAIIENSYNIGSISGNLTAYIGGIAAYNSGEIINCYNAGSLSGSSFIGGFVSQNMGNIIDGYYDHTKNTGDGINEDTNNQTVTGISTAVMQGKAAPSDGISYFDGEGTIKATGTTAFVDALNGGLTSILSGQLPEDTDVEYWKADSTTPTNGGYPVMTSDKPVHFSVDSASVTAGTPLNVSISQDGIICIVAKPSINYTSATAEQLIAAMGTHFLQTTKGKSISFPTTGLSAGQYQIYFLFGEGTVSSPIDITLTGSGSGNNGNTSPAPTDKTVDGTTTTGSGDTATSTAKILPTDTNTSTVANVIVKLGNVTVTAPSSVLSGALGNDASSWLELSQNPTSSSSQTAVTTTAQQNGVTLVSTLDVDLTRFYSNGTSEPIHQLTGNVNVVIKLTDAQIAAITDPSKAQLLYYNPDTGALTNMGATFDLAAGTATFSTSHFSTFVIATKDTAQSSGIGVSYDSHVQNIGWLPYVKDGNLSGTTAKSLRLEAINVKLTGDVPTGASISYQTYLQGSGWQKAVSNGALSGTTGKKLRAEALRVTIKGLDGYRVRYRVHVQNLGWQDWKTTNNGTDITAAALAGTTGKALRIEAVEIVLEKIPS